MNTITRQTIIQIVSWIIDFGDTSEGNCILFSQNVHSFKRSAEIFKSFLASTKISLTFVILYETRANQNDLDFGNLETCWGLHTCLINL